MGVSAFFIAVMLALLELLVDFAAGYSIPGSEDGTQLTVLIRTGDIEPGPEFTMEKKAAPSLSQQPIVSAVPVDRRQVVVTHSSPELPAVSPPVKDWRAIAKSAARTTVDDRFKKEEFRASMWRQTHSIMFEPVGDFVVREEEPVISDFRFRPQIHVVGLGVTIGSCFIGIPLAGVPVEQRTVAINLVVCAQDSG
jgi:hypothetical protein